MEYDLPKDPAILLSYVNTQLRDHFDSFEDFCKTKNVPGNVISAKLNELNYAYDTAKNQFV